jgi:DNA-binding transcriptional ArsR family regulator
VNQLVYYIHTKLLSTIWFSDNPGTMDNLTVIFSALSHETRRGILEQLTRGESRLSDLAEPFDMSQTAVSKHVRILSDAGLVTVERRGRTRHCRLNADPMKQATEWLIDYRAFWLNQFDNLAQHLVNKED